MLTFSRSPWHIEVIPLATTTAHPFTALPTDQSMNILYASKVATAMASSRRGAGSPVEEKMVRWRIIRLHEQKKKRQATKNH